MKSRNVAPLVVCIVIISVVVGCGESSSDTQPAADSQAAAPGGSASAGDATVSDTVELPQPEGPARYPVPDTNPAKLLDFVNELAVREPVGQTPEEIGEDVRQMMASRLQASNRIIDADDVDPGLREAGVKSKVDTLRTLAIVDPEGLGKQFAPYLQSLADSGDARQSLIARVGGFQFDMDQFRNLQTDDPQKIIDAMKSILDDELAGHHEFLATQFAGVILNERGHPNLATDALRLVGERFKSADDDRLAGEAQNLLKEVDFRSKVFAALDGDDQAIEALLKAVSDKLAVDPTDVMALSAVVNAGQMLEFSGSFDGARKVFEMLAEKFKTSQDKQLAEHAKRSAELAFRRLNLIGKPITLEGQALDGTPFTWKKYEGKVVLIDFWTTYSPPWLDEVPNLLSSYDRFHDEGFEIVGVNLDDDQRRVYEFLRTRKLPWTTVIHETLGGFANPNAVRYGVEAVPFFVLVGRDGMVADIHTRGPRLQQRVQQLLEEKGKSGGTAERTKPAARRVDRSRETDTSRIVRRARTWFVGLEAEQATESIDEADEAIDLESINPYAPDESLPPRELLELIFDMQDKPLSIQRRDGFSTGLIQAADRVLATETSERYQTIALLAKFEYLHRDASLGNDAADHQLEQTVEQWKDDEREKVAKEVHFLQLERRVLDSQPLPVDDVAALLGEVEDFFSKTTTSDRHLRLASATVRAINRIEDGDERERYFEKFGLLWAKSESRELASYGRRLAKKPVTEEMSLVGKPMQLAGVTADGTALDLNDYQGQVVLVDFWATWCAPCLQAMPELKKLYVKHHSQGFDVVGVSLDRDLEALAKFLDDNDIPWNNLAGEGNRDLAEKHNVRGIPSLILVDREGLIVAVGHELADIAPRVAELVGDGDASEG